MSHTFHEDEQRVRHFEEWDRVLDDHLDTLRALDAGVDPGLDVVWDDTEYLHPLIAPIQRFIDAAARSYRKVVEEIRPVLLGLADKIQDAARTAVTFIIDISEWRARSDHRTESLAPTKPTRIDTRRVTHTRTKPPKPTTLYRRRTP